MNYFLFKTEPDEFSIADLAASPDRTARWDQIRNYQARNILRDQVQAGDRIFIYHSRCASMGIAGLAQATTPAYPDPTQFDPQSPYFDARATADSPRWFAVDIRLLSVFPRLIPLAAIKAEHRLADLVLLKQARLSVQPVSASDAAVLLQMAEQT